MFVCLFILTPPPPVTVICELDSDPTPSYVSQYEQLGEPPEQHLKIYEQPLIM